MSNPDDVGTAQLALQDLADGREKSADELQLLRERRGIELLNAIERLEKKLQGIEQRIPDARPALRRIEADRRWLRRGLIVATIANLILLGCIVVAIFTGGSP